MIIKNVVIALIWNQHGKLLIARRNDENIPDAHDKWELVGGKMEYGEHPDQTVIREVKEETGLEPHTVNFLGQMFTQFWKNGSGEEFQVLLLPYECHVETDSDTVESFDPKISELKFIDPLSARDHNFLPLDLEIIELTLQANPPVGGLKAIS